MLEQRAKRIPIPGGTASLIALRSGGRTRGPPYKSLNSKLPSFRWSGAIFPPFSWVKEGAASVTDTGIAHQLQCFFNNEHMLPPCGRKASCLGRPHLLLLRSWACMPSLWPHGLQPARLLYPWYVLRKNTAVGCHFLLQGIFTTKASNPCLLHLLHCRWILDHWAVGELPLLRLGHFLKWKGAFNLSAGTAGVNWDYARQTGTGNVREKEDDLAFFRGSVLNCATPFCLLPARSFLQLPTLAILHLAQG